MAATFYIGDAIEVINNLPESSIDLVLTSPPFLALRSYLPQDHPDKALEGGSQATPGEYIDWLLDVVEACARVLAPHGSLCFELGDTYSGSGGAGGDSAIAGLREGNPPRFRQGYVHADGRKSTQAEDYGAGVIANSGGNGWPLAKSLSLIPETFRFAMVYGHNPHTGRTTPPWRLRNVIRWVRPNPPVGALGDKFRPATSELMVFCKAKDRFFDLDAVRGEVSEWTQNYSDRMPISERAKESVQRSDETRLHTGGGGLNQQGAPPLDWWNIPLLEGEEPTRMEPKEPRGNLNYRPMTKALKASLTKGLTTEVGDLMHNNPLGTPPLDWWNIPPGGFSGAHYAVWPPELLVKPIKAMCPEKVCRRCGEARRRIVKTVNATEERLALADYLRQQREAQAITVRELTAAFPSASGGMTGCVWNWENAANVPTAEQWPTLKALLDLDDRFDTLVTGERAWTESEIGYEMLNSNGPKNVGRTSETAMGNLTTRANRMPAPDNFSDCLHDNYRPGLVLDPFAGSGTTLSVATGHGRDAIGIDLDERNYELALDRVGPLILERGTEPARRINS